MLGGRARASGNVVVRASFVSYAAGTARTKLLVFLRPRPRGCSKNLAQERMTDELGKASVCTRSRYKVQCTWYFGRKIIDDRKTVSRSYFFFSFPLKSRRGVSSTYIDSVVRTYVATPTAC